MEKRNEIKLTWTGNDMELSYDGDMPISQVIYRLNEALAIMVQDSGVKLYDPEKASKN